MSGLIVEVWCPPGYDTEWARRLAQNSFGCDATVRVFTTTDRQFRKASE